MNNFNNPLNPTATRLILLWFSAMAGLMAIGGTIWFAHTVWWVAHATKAQGRIVAMERRGSSKGNPMYSPVFAYDDGSGVTHTQICGMSSDAFSYEAGEKVTVLYDPARPIHSNIDSFVTVWLFPLVTIGLSLFSGSFVVLLFFASNSMMKKRESQGII